TARVHAAADAEHIAQVERVTLDTPPVTAVGSAIPPPHYTVACARRVQKLRRLRANPTAVPALRVYYRENPWQFICDYGVTTDPRNALLTPPQPVMLPFLLFPKQIECVRWILARAQAREPGLIEKSRDCGL